MADVVRLKLRRLRIDLPNGGEKWVYKEPLMGANIGTLPSVKFPPNDKDNDLVLPYPEIPPGSSAAERRQAVAQGLPELSAEEREKAYGQRAFVRAFMRSFGSERYQVVREPRAPAQLDLAPGLPERMTAEIRATVERLRGARVDEDAIRERAWQWLRVLHSRWRLARTDEGEPENPDPPAREAHSWLNTYGDIVPLELVDRQADALGFELAERATALVNLLVAPELRESVLADPELVERWPWSAGRLLVGADTDALAETTWPDVDDTVTYETWRDTRMARAVLRVAERMTEPPWPHSGWPGRAAPETVAEWLAPKGRRPRNPRISTNRKLLRLGWGANLRNRFEWHQSYWLSDLAGNPLGYGLRLEPEHRLYLGAKVLKGGVPAHEFDARDNAELVFLAENGRYEVQRYQPSNGKEGIPVRRPLPDTKPTPEEIKRAAVNGMAPDPEWADMLDLGPDGVDPRNDYKYTSRTWALHISEIPYQGIALLYLLEEKARAAVRPRRKRLELAPLAQRGYIKAPADRINKATIEAFAPGAMRELTDEESGFLQISVGGSYWRAYTFGRDGGELKGAVGFPRDPGEAIWKLLQNNGALAVKAQYALWARAYAETGADPERFVMMSIPDFCDDLGYSRNKGSHKLTNKRAAMEVLELLTSIELDAIYQPAGKAARRFRGPIWIRGGIAEELDNYGDLWGANRVGDPAAWEPVAFAYAPGMFFRDREWRTYNNRVATIGAGLLRLSTKNDQWAIMVGGYLGMLARMNGYQPSVLRVTTLLSKTGLYEADRKHPGRMLDKLETALEKLQAVGVIGSWGYPTNGSIEEPDMDDPEVIANLRNLPDNRARQCIRIEWPDALDERAKQLAANKTKRIQTSRKRKSRKTPPAQLPTMDE
jgi:hypothetical protein